jgi:hypothetical protein
MKHALCALFSVVLATAVIPSPALADCPDKPYKCDFGWIGGQGMCWKTWRCVTCGTTTCPKLPAQSFRDVPRRAEFACIDHAVKSGETNGCSNPSPDPASGFYRNYFKPACDQHDLCYLNTNGLSKRECDDNFKANMEWMCDTYFTGALNIAQRGTCRAAAGTWWAVLASDIKSTKNYDDAQAWNKANCPDQLAPVTPIPTPTPPSEPPQKPAPEPKPNPGSKPGTAAPSPAAFIPGTYRAQHPHWGGTVTLNADGTYARDNGDPGRWTFDGTTLVLNWTNWGPEPVVRATPSTYRATSGFTLELIRPAFVPGTYRAQHPHWGGTVTLNADGTYARDNGDPGTWTCDGTTLVLNWTKWRPETLTRVGTDTYRNAGGFSLEKNP